MVGLCRWSGDTFSGPGPASPFHLCCPQSTSGSGGEEEEHAQYWDKLQRQCHNSKPGVFQLSLSDIGLPVLLREAT